MSYLGALAATTLLVAGAERPGWYGELSEARVSASTSGRWVKLAMQLLAEGARMTSQGAPPPERAERAIWGGRAARRRGAPSTDREGASVFEAERAKRHGCSIEAEAAFQQGWDLRQSYDVATNLGDCELEIGQSREAAEHLTYALKHFPVVAKAERRERLVQRLKEARERVGTLVVRVNLAGAEIWADGRKVGLSPLSEEVFVDPGKAHTVEAKLAGYEGKAQTVELEKGERILVTVELGKKEGGAGAAGPVAGAPAGSGSGSGSERQVPPGTTGASGPRKEVLIAGGVTAGAALVVGVIFTLISNGKASEADAKLEDLHAKGGSTPCTSGKFTADCSTLLHLNQGSDTFHNLAIAGYTSAGVAGVATLVYALWPVTKAEPRTAVSLVPMLGAGTRGLVIRGGF